MLKQKLTTMTLKRIIPNLLTTVLLVTGPVFMLFAQEDTSSTQPDRTYNFFGPSGYSDEMFISKNIEDNTKEIELAKLALDKSSNGSIKSIAQDMVEHHGKLLEDLKQLRSVSGISGNEEDAVAEEQEQVATEENNMQNDSASVTNPPANVKTPAETPKTTDTPAETGAGKAANAAAKKEARKSSGVKAKSEVSKDSTMPDPKPTGSGRRRPGGGAG